MVTASTTDPVIPEGISNNADRIAWQSKQRNYFHTDLRVILRVKKDPTRPGGVAEGFATPMTDFTLAAYLKGYRTNPNQPASPTGAVAVHESVNLWIRPFLGATDPNDEYLEFLVTNPNSNWINVAGTPGDGIWNELEFRVVPTDDGDPEGTETFEVFVEANVELPTDRSQITGTTRLTEFIHLDTETLTITDEPGGNENPSDGDPVVDETTPRGDAEISVDNTCSCACSVCGGNVQVRPLDGQANLRPRGPANRVGPADWGPSHLTAGASGTEQTVQVSFPFDNIDASINTPVNRIRLLSDVQNDNSMMDQSRFELQLPVNHGRLGDRNGIAVRLPVTLAANTPSGVYDYSVQAIAAEPGEGVRADAVWDAAAPLMVNNLNVDFDLAPGWVFPFDYRLHHGATDPADGTPGAALFRPDQSASWFRLANATQYQSPSETFETLEYDNQGHHLRQPDGSEMTLKDVASMPGVAKLHQQVDAAGNVTKYEYHPDGKIKSITDPLGRVTRFAWNNTAGVQNQLTITDQQEQQVRYTYSFTDQRVSVEHLSNPTQLSESREVLLTETFQYNDRNEIISHVRGSGSSQQTTGITYRGYGPNGSLRRIDTITQPDGGQLKVETIGIDDALPDDNGRWLTSQQWETIPANAPAGSPVRQSRRTLIDPIWTRAWEGEDQGTTDNPVSIMAAIDAQSIPRRSLKEFENYAAFTFLANDEEGMPQPPRHTEMVLDRRGRMMASEDPLGNRVSYTRKVEYVTADSGRTTGLTKMDRGEITQIKGPDPDGSQPGRDLKRPITGMTYQEGTPFRLTTTLPEPLRADNHGQPQQLAFSPTASGYASGQPTRVTDELGNATEFERTGSRPDVVFRPFNDVVPFDDGLWQNPVDRHDVNNDGRTTPIDALRIINELNNRIHSFGRNEGAQPEGTFRTARRPFLAPYFDVNGSDTVTPLDALRVINRINVLDRSGEAEVQTQGERTDIIYVDSPQYQSNAARLNGYVAADDAFTMKTLPGIEITRSGRPQDGDRVRIYLYHLDAGAGRLRGQVKAVIETFLDDGQIVTEPTRISVTRFGYDSRGYLASVTDPIERTTDYVHDPIGRLSQVTAPASDSVVLNNTTVSLGRTVTKYRHDAFGNVFQIAVIGNTLRQVAKPQSGQPGFDGQVVEQTRVTTMRYDVNDRLVAIAHPAPTIAIDPDSEQPLTVAFGGDPTVGLTQLATRPLTVYRYDQFNQLIETTQSLTDGAAGDTAMTTLKRDRLGRVTERLDPSVELFNPDDSTNPTVDRPLTKFEYNTAGTLRRMTDPSGTETEYFYDSWDRLVRSVVSGSTLGSSPQILRTDVYQYDVVTHAPDSQRLVSRNSGWQTTVTTFDGPEGSKILSQVTTQSDRDGRTKAVTRTLTDSQTATNKYEYFSDGLIAATTDPRSGTTDVNGTSYGILRTTFGYDELARQDEINRPAVTPASGMTAPSISRLQYDLADQLIRSTDPTGVQTFYFYADSGDLDRRFLVTADKDITRDGTLSLPTAIGQPAPVRWESTHDGFGDLVRSFTDAESIDLAAQYRDALGRVMVSQEGLTASTGYQYDRASRRTGLIDPNGNLTTWVHDAMDRVKSDTATIPAGPVTRTYQHDAVGNLLYKTDRNGRSTRYTHDGLHQLSVESWVGTPESLSFDFDAIGQLTSATANHSIQRPLSGSTITRDFDVGGRLTTETLGYKESVAGVPEFNAAWLRQFDSADNVVRRTGQIKGNDDHVDTMVFNDQNWLTSLTRDVAGSELDQHVVLQHDAAGRHRGTRRYTAISDAGAYWDTDRAFDALGRINQIDHTFSNSGFGTFRSGYGVTFGQGNRIESVTSDNSGFSPPTNLPADGRQVFSYDTRGQVDQETGTSLASTIGYDGSGNRTSRSSSPGVTNSIGADNRLLRDADYTYAYDNEGNRTGRTSLSDPSEVWGYGYDHRNRLIWVDTPTGLRVNNAYDALDRWVGRRSGSGPLEVFVYDGDQVSMRLFSGGSLIERNLWGAGRDELLAQQSAGRDVTWTLTDHQGSVRDRSDAAGRLLSHVTYTAFGEVDPALSRIFEPIDVVSFGYTARQFNGTSRLQYNTHRWYEAATGVWISKDPIGLGPDSNPYRYVRNQPTTLTDPSGLEPPIPLTVPIGTLGPDSVGRPPFPISSGPSIGQAPGSPPSWMLPFLRDPRSSNELQAPGVYHWYVGNLYWRLGGHDAASGIADICEDPGAAIYNSTIGLPGNVSSLILNWDNLSDLAKQDMVAKFGVGVFTGNIGAAALRRVPAGYTRAYRAVSEAEYIDLMSTGKFRLGPNSMEGKWFADTPGGVLCHGDDLHGRGNYRVIEAYLPDSAPSLYRMDNLDGYGPARYLDLEDLQNIYPRRARVR